MRRYRARMISVAVLATLILATMPAPAGSLDPTSGPGPTMHTLDEIYQNVDVFAPTRTLSATTAVVRAGYYATTNLAQVDTDLTASNIKTNITVFGIAGSLSGGGGIVYTNTSVALPKTGQLTVYLQGDDGDYQKGYPMPNPRFTTGTGTASNCATDNLTGLMWLKNPDLVLRDWATAVAYCEGLDGSGGRGGYTDWRMPNELEQQSILDYNFQPAMPAIHPFGANVAAYPYWSSTIAKWDQNWAWFVDTGSGTLSVNQKSTTYYVMPVRGGK